jgi:ribonuclease BN (tRNA processing enzyme)
MHRGATISLALFLLIPACGTGEKPDQKEEAPTADRPAVVPVEPAARPGDTRATKVVMLGTGTPVLDPARSGPATAVVTGGRAYLVDFGRGVVDRAEEAFRMGIDALDVRRLRFAFTTHLHSDHTVGLPDLMLTPIPVGRNVPLQIFGPPGLRDMVRHIESAFSEDLSIRAKGRDLGTLPGYNITVEEIEEGVVFRDGNVKVTAFPVTHGGWPHAFGYRFDTRDRTIVISGDTAPTDRVVRACNGCDVLVHEVYCEAGFRMGSPGFRHYHGNSHTSTVQLADIAARAKPKLLVLYHQLLFGCTPAALLGELTDRYKGEVAFANDLDVF